MAERCGAHCTCYESCDSDDDDERIDDVVMGDDVEALLSYLRSPEGKGCLNYEYYRLKFTKSICVYNAVNIATAMLEGKLGETIDVAIDVNEHNMLHHAARMGNPELVQLLLSHGARTDIRSTIELLTGDKGLLPLAIALGSARSLASSHKWEFYPRGQSILNLIVTLCDPSLNHALTNTKLLAGSSKDVEEEALCCAMEGKLIDLAVWLLLAREKVLVPLTFPSEDGAGSTRKMTIHQRVKDHIVTLFYEENKLMTEFKPEELTRVQMDIMVMGATALLLEVFEKAGSTIDEFSQLQKLKPANLIHSSYLKELEGAAPAITTKEYLYRKVRREQMERDENDLALRLEGAGVKFEAGNFHFSIRDCLNSNYSTGIHFEHLEIPSDNFFSHSFPMLQQANSPFSQGKELPRDGDRLSVSTQPLLKTRVWLSMEKSNNADQIAKSISGSQYSRNVDVQLKKNQTKVIEQKAKYLSREKLAYMARFVKR